MRTALRFVQQARHVRVILYHLHIPDSGDLQRELRAFVFFSEDQGEHYSGSCPPDLRLMVRMGDVESWDQSHQERLHLYDAIQKPSFSVSGRANDIKDDRLTRIATRCSS